GSAVLRHPSAARGVGGLGFGAARRAGGALLPRDGADVPAHGGGRALRPGAPLVPGLARLLRALAPLEGVGHHTARRAARAGRLSAAAGASAPGERAVRGARPRRGGARLRGPAAPARDAHAGAARRPPAHRAGGPRALLLPLEDGRALAPVARLSPRGTARPGSAALPAEPPRGGGDHGPPRPHPAPLAVGPGGVGVLRRHRLPRARLRADRAADRGGPLHLPRLPALGGAGRGRRRPSRTRAPAPRVVGECGGAAGSRSPHP